MIGQITGKIAHTDERFVILDVGGVGYKISAPSETLLSLQSEDTATLITHLVVREDALDLYGFFTSEEKDFFELLIGISGIGPKAAINIFNLAPLESIKEAIIASDSNYLTKVSGIGKKTAQKLVLELKDKVTSTGSSPEGKRGGNYRGNTEVFTALESLGYTRTEVRSVLGEIPKEIEGTNEKIREALKILGTK